MLVVPAYAKVNLSLDIVGRRPDGWHDIASVIATVDWHDLVGVALGEPNRATPEPAVASRATQGPPVAGPPRDTHTAVRFHLQGDHAKDVPAGADNLAARAAALLPHLAGLPADALSIDVWLCKQLPAAAGLGGGSADAAAVLRAGQTLLAAEGAPIAAQTLAQAAAELGSDVPAVLAGGTLLATGRGEHLRVLPAPNLHLAIAVAGPSVTAAAYAALTDDERHTQGRSTTLADALTQGKPIDEALLGSALEAPACRAAPGLAASLARLRALTPDHRWHLTGSGGAAFALAEDAATAASLADHARSAGFPARACRTVPTRLTADAKAP